MACIMCKFGSATYLVIQSDNNVGAAVNGLCRCKEGPNQLPLSHGDYPG